jgi:hypothetical protein
MCCRIASALTQAVHAFATVCTFASRSAETIFANMRTGQLTYPTFLKIAAAGIVLALLGGWGTGLWLERGAALFLALAETGLAWCL